MIQQMNMTTEMQQPVTCKHPTLSAIDCDDSAAYKCDGCLEMGYGSRYRCPNGCDYDLHEECITASEEAHPHFFERRPFTLQVEHFPKSSNLCTACGIPVTGWRYYHSLENGTYIFLQPCCMKMPHCIETDDGDKLFLKQQLVSLECGFCERPTLEGPVKGWAYMSADQRLVAFENYWNMYGQTEEQEDEKHNEYDNNNDSKAVEGISIQQVVYQHHHHHHYHYVGQPSYQQQQQYYGQHNYNQNNHKRKVENSGNLPEQLPNFLEQLQIQLAEQLWPSVNCLMNKLICPYTPFYSTCSLRFILLRGVF